MVKKLVDMSIKDYFVKVVKPIIFILLISSGTLFFIHTLLPQGFLRLFVISFLSIILVSSLFYSVGLNVIERGMVVQFVNQFLTKMNFKK